MLWPLRLSAIEIIIILLRMAINNKYSDFEAPWKNKPAIRESLLQRIKNSIVQGSNSTQSLFTEEKIAEEYYKSWLELPATATLQKIAQHPMLTKKHRAVIDEQLGQQKMSQVKWSLAGTAITFILYSAFFSRMPTFRNFFNHEKSWMVTRVVKKTTAAYGIFLVWVASLTSTYEQSLPLDLQKKGLFKELGILGKPSNN